MALPLDTTGMASSNHISNEVHSTTSITERYFVPNSGSFYVRNLKIYNVANGLLLEPLTQYIVLQQNTDAANLTLSEVAQVIYISDPAVLSVKLDYQAVGGDYESIHDTVNPLIAKFISGKTSSLITNNVAGNYVTVAPRILLSTPHDLDDGGTFLQQLHAVAEAVEAGDPSGMQMVYEFLINYTAAARNNLTTSLTAIRSKLTALDNSTRLVNGQYLFTREVLNPYVYLNYGNWVSNPNMLFYGSDGDNPRFGEFVDVEQGDGLLAVRTMAYRRDDSAAGVSYTLTSDQTQVNEGDSITFTLTTSGLTAGNRITYTVTGVDSNDIADGDIYGDFILDANGHAAVTFVIANDARTDGNKNMVLRLIRSPEVYSVVRIIDTSKEVTYAAFFTSDTAGNTQITAANEGTTAYLQVTANGLNDGDSVYILYNDSTTDSDDFVGTLTGSATVTNGKVVIPYLVKADYVTDGSELLVINLCTAPDITTRVVRTTLSITDTAKTPTIAAYFASAATSTTAITTVNEGVTVYLRVTTTNLPAGQVLTLQYGGTTTQDDFTGMLPTSISVDASGVTVIPYTITADLLTEGDELFGVTVMPSVRMDISATAAITVKDTSVGRAIASISMSSDSAGTTALSSLRVPTNAYLVIKTTGFANGDVINLDYSGSDNTVKTLLGTQVSSVVTVTINNNIGWVLLNFQDTNGVYTTVGNMKIIASYSGTVMATLNTTINPRTLATATLSFVNSAGTTLTTVNEGDSFRVKIVASNVSLTDPIGISYAGTANANDFTNTLPTSLAVQSGIAYYLDYTVKADGLIEGTETFTVTATLPYGSGTVSGTINIADTSVPIANLRFTSDTAGNTQITQTNEGTTAYLQIVTSGYPDGTVLTLSHSGTISAADVTGGFPASVTVVSGKATVAYRFAEDYTAEGQEYMTVTAKYGTNTLGSATLIVNDTSLPGPSSVYWSRSSDPSAAVGSMVFNEGETAYLHIASNNVPVGSVINLSYAGTASSADFVGGLPATAASGGLYTTLTLPILADMLEESGPNEYLNVTATYGTVSATSGNISIVDTSKSFFLTDGGVGKLLINPGDSYFIAVQGGGGAGGTSKNLVVVRSSGSTSPIYTTTDPGVTMNGDNGTPSNISVRGLTSNATYGTITGGGGMGGTAGWEAVDIPVGYDYPTDVRSRGYDQIYPARWIYSGYATAMINPGYVLGNPWDSFLLDKLTVSGLSAGKDSISPVNEWRFDNSTYTGFATNIRELNRKLLGPGIVNNSLNYPGGMSVTTARQYGNGGAGGLGWGNYGRFPGKGGGSGGLSVVVFKNTTTEVLELTCTAGSGGQPKTVTDTSLGGYVDVGKAGDAGYVYACKVTDTYKLTKSVTPITGSIAAGPSFKNITVPVGKRLKLQVNLGKSWDGVDIPYTSIAVMKYNGVTYGEPAIVGNQCPIFQVAGSASMVMPFIYDKNGVMNLFEVLEWKVSGLVSGDITPTSTLPWPMTETTSSPGEILAVFPNKGSTEAIIRIVNWDDGVSTLHKYTYTLEDI